MKNFWISLLFIGSIWACNNSQQSEVNGSKQPEEIKSYLPIADFILEDIKQVDSFAGGILLKTIRGQKKDSAFIQREAFHKIAKEFLLTELDSSVFYSQFSETSLMDESTQMLNFIYTADSNQTSLRKAIVYVSPSLSTDKVSRIYMETESREGDTTVSRKLTWKMRQYLIIAENRQTSSGYNATLIRKAIWDAQQFADQ